MQSVHELLVVYARPRIAPALQPVRHTPLSVGEARVPK
jgi:hypothetical protein